MALGARVGFLEYSRALERRALYIMCRMGSSCIEVVLVLVTVIVCLG